jgi:hypothetical protein
MKRRKFIASSAALSALPLGLAASGFTAPQSDNEVYELREYEIKFGGGGEANLHKYLQNALIPTLNRLGVLNVGVFKEMSQSNPAKVYVLIPYPSFEAYGKIIMDLASDETYRTLSQEYDNMPAEKPIFNRYDTRLMLAFDGIPKIEVPAKNPRIFELRTYEGFNEDAVRRKVGMFNDEELPLFYDVKLNPVFFGNIIAGKSMPALTYMLVFRDLDERDANWKVFVDSPLWKEISARSKYANTVSNIYREFLIPTDYSQV